MKRRKVPGLLELLGSPIGGIGRDKKTNDSFTTTFKFYDKQLAKKISKKQCIYRNRKKQFYVRAPYTAQFIPITDPHRFIKERVKIYKRHEITESVTAGVISYWLNPYLGYARDLPDQDLNYPLMCNGYFEMHYGKFHESKLNKNENPGYSRFLVNATYVEDTQGWIEESDPILPNLAQLVTGIVTQRRIVWVTNKELRNFLIKLLETVLPESGAYQYLSSSAYKSDYQNAADSDCHCAIVKVASANELTDTFWGKLKVLADNQKPVLIQADFLPFTVRDVDGKDDEGVTLAEYLQKHLYIEPESMPNRNLPSEVNDEIVNTLVSSALRKLFEKINAVEPDICPEVDAIFSRPDPNNIPEMITWYINNEMLHTEVDSDVIQVKEFADRLKAVAIKAGGDGKNYTPNGIGMRLKRLDIKTTEQKLPSTKGKVSVFIGYKWKY